MRGVHRDGACRVFVHEGCDEKLGGALRGVGRTGCRSDRGSACSDGSLKHAVDIRHDDGHRRRTGKVAPSCGQLLFGEGVLVGAGLREGDRPERDGAGGGTEAVKGGRRRRLRRHRSASSLSGDRMREARGERGRTVGDGDRRTNGGRDRDGGRRVAVGDGRGRRHDCRERAIRIATHVDRHRMRLVVAGPAATVGGRLLHVEGVGAGTVERDVAKVDGGALVSARREGRGSSDRAVGSDARLRATASRCHAGDREVEVLVGIRGCARHGLRREVCCRSVDRERLVCERVGDRGGRLDRCGEAAVPVVGDVDLHGLG